MLLIFHSSENVDCRQSIWVFFIYLCFQTTESNNIFSIKLETAVSTVKVVNATAWRALLKKLCRSDIVWFSPQMIGQLLGSVTPKRYHFDEKFIKKKHPLGMSSIGQNEYYRPKSASRRCITCTQVFLLWEKDP